MIRDLSEYKTFIFDCDGVVLNSNRVKTDAFYTAALPYGESAAESLVDFHLLNGGVSRYKKFSYFLNSIVGERAGPGLDELLQLYSSNVFEGLLHCAEAPCLRELRTRTLGARWLIVSGGDQAELRKIFTLRGLESIFEGGIFGSPDAKEDIIVREIGLGRILMPALFLGDSLYDYKVASAAGIDFLFLSEWTEVRGWEEWVNDNGIDCRPNLTSLLSCSEA